MQVCRLNICLEPFRIILVLWKYLVLASFGSVSRTPPHDLYHLPLANVPLVTLTAFSMVYSTASNLKVTSAVTVGGGGGGGGGSGSLAAAAAGGLGLGVVFFLAVLAFLGLAEGWDVAAAGGLGLAGGLDAVVVGTGTGLGLGLGVVVAVVIPLLKNEKDDCCFSAVVLVLFASGLERDAVAVVAAVVVAVVVLGGLERLGLKVAVLKRAVALVVVAAAFDSFGREESGSS